MVADAVAALRTRDYTCGKGANKRAGYGSAGLHGTYGPSAELMEHGVGPGRLVKRLCCGSFQCTGIICTGSDAAEACVYPPCATAYSSSSRPSRVYFQTAVLFRLTARFQLPTMRAQPQARPALRVAYLKTISTMFGSSFVSECCNVADVAKEQSERTVRLCLSAAHGFA